VRSKANHYVYSKEEGGGFIYVALYVDDMLLIGNNMDAIKEVKKKLGSRCNEFHSRNGYQERLNN
jgi:hypothetical protein